MASINVSTLLESAELAQGVGDLDTALTQYESALTILIADLKLQPKGSEKHEQLVQTINIYLNEAESIKKRLADRKLNSSSPFPPQSSTTPSQSQSTSRGLSSILNFKTAPKPSNTPTSISATSNSKPAPVPDNFDYSAPVKAKPKNYAAPTSSSARRSISPQPATSKRTSSPMPNSKNNEKTKENEYESQILSEMLETAPGVQWTDIAGLSFAKQTLQEAVILPNLRPDLFVGLRAPPRGVLLFGPPGTGKTLLAKAVATESGFSFFSITPSSVTSKYVGEGEKLMKALFSVARNKQPAVIFFDEIDALLSTRKDNEHDASRRLKTEFLTQVDGASTNSEDRLLIMAATNIPWDIDEAVLRRLVKRIYVPLPDNEARSSLIRHLLKKQKTGLSLSEAEVAEVVHLTQGYSASDLTALCRESSMGPIREIKPELLRTVRVEDLRPVNLQDFLDSVATIRPSVSSDHLITFSKWTEQFAAIR